MAESKKKSTAKKPAAKASSAKEAPKKSAAKKAPATAAKKSNTQKSTAKKAATTKVEKKEQPVSKTAGSENNNWLVAAIILGAVVIILVAIIGVLYFNQGSTEEQNEDTTPVTGGEDQVSLLVVEDPSCKNCQVDMFITQVEENLIPNLEVEKLSIQTQEGKNIADNLEVNQVPVYLFSKNIDQRDDWESQLAEAFLLVELEGEQYYLLNPQFIPNKVLINEPVVTEDALVIGDENAPVTVIEFSDFECPFCAIAEGNEELVAQFSEENPNYQPPIPNVIEDYVESGDVKLVFYNFPIASLHPDARVVHNAALCAGEQDGFKEYSRKIWDSRSEWTAASDRVETLKGYGADLGLDENQFNSCLDSKKYDAQIDEEMALGQTYGVSGTPAFFVGKTFISGAQDYTVFKELIEAELAAQE